MSCRLNVGELSGGNFNCGRWVHRTDTYQERPSGADTSQSERDWAYAIRKLKAGEDPQQIIRDMGAYRSKDRYDKNDPTKVIAPAKARPYYYAEHTVTQAMAHLGMTKRPEAPPKSGASREAESQPSR